MKKLIILNVTKFFSFLTLLGSVLFFAQDSTVVKTTHVTTRTEEWQSNPVYWVIGGVALIIIVALIASGRRKTED